MATNFKKIITQMKIKSKLKTGVGLSQTPDLKIEEKELMSLNLLYLWMMEIL